MSYATLTQIRRYLDIDQSVDDTLLQSCLDRADAFIDRYTGRTFAVSGDTTRTFDAVHDVDGDYLYLDYDLCAITTVTNGDSVEVSASEYTTEPRNVTPYYALKLLASANKTWDYTTDHEDAISILGKWGYSTSAPTDIVQAGLRLASWYYRQKDATLIDEGGVAAAGVVTAPAAIPADVMTLLAPYRRLT